MAVSIAEALSGAAYPAVVSAQLRAHAWNDLGRTLRYLGRYHESIDIFEHADRQLAHFDALTHDRAMIHFNLAAALQEVARHDEALQMLHQTREIFRQHEDARRLVLSGLAEGTLLQRLRRYREAREAHLLLLASAPRIDRESLAALQHAIGVCSVDARGSGVGR